MRRRTGRAAIVGRYSATPLRQAGQIGILPPIYGAPFIEHQLAHAVRDPNGRAYNRTAHLAERKKMVQAWADYLDKLKAGAEVIPLHGGVA